MVICAWGRKDGLLLSFLFLSFLFGRFAFKVKQGSKHGWVAARSAEREGDLNKSVSFPEF
jgi:hypothetical protein